MTLVSSNRHSCLEEHNLKTGNPTNPNAVSTIETGIRNKGGNVGLTSSKSCGITNTQRLELTILRTMGLLESLESGSKGNNFSVIITGQVSFQDLAITEMCPLY